MKNNLKKICSQSLLISFFFLFTKTSIAQNFLNGSFENNTAGALNQINTSNAVFNGMMANTNAFGTFGNLDIIRTNTWGGGFAQNCTWYVALTGGGTDAFTMGLSAPLVTGTTYTISFWDRRDGGWPASPIQLGLSTVNNTAGTIIYTAPAAPALNVWTQRTFTFVAPNNGQYISVVQSAGTTQWWAHVDNFVMNNAVGTGSLNITPSATSICQGSSATFTATGATSYTWSPGASLNTTTANIVVATPNATTIYTVTGNTGCVMSTNTIALNVINSPTLTVTPSVTSICSGASVTLTAAGALNYTWSPGATLNTTNGNLVVATPSSNTIYTVSGSNGIGCAGTATAQITINPNPVIVVNNPSVCVGQAINLNASGGLNYLWAGPLNYTSNVQNPVIANATIGMAGQYTVVVTSAQGCTSTAVAGVNVYPVPNPIITNNSPVCQGGTLNLQGSGGATYSWSGPNAFSSTLSNPSITNVSLPAGGVYTLIATAGTCSGSVTSTVVINPLPTVVITANSPVCIGQPVQFTGSGGGTYSWSGPSGFTSTISNPLIAVSALNNSGAYTLTVIDANGCVNSSVKNLLVNPMPIVAATGATVCENTNALLSANGGVIYNWTGPAGFTSNSQNPAILNITLNGAGVYTVLVTDANTCTNTAVASVQVNPMPVAAIQTNGPVCVNSILNLSGSGGINYSWTGPNGFSSAGSTTTLSVNSTACSGTYFLTVSDAIGCSATGSVAVHVNGLPQIAITSLGPDSGCAPFCDNLTCTSSVPVKFYNWDFGNGTNAGTSTVQACFNTSGTYTINTTVVDTNGCSNASVYTVNVYPVPVADFNYSPLKPIENSDNVIFTDASYGATITSWNWYFMDNAQFTSTSQNPAFLYTEAGEYAAALVVKSNHGCLDTIIKSIIVGQDFGIWVPNTFTPNGDGLNDAFFVKGFGITKFRMDIFDRWGTSVFSTTDVYAAWDGTVKGITAKEDTYTWKISITSVFGKSKDLTGHVTLIK